MMPGGYVAGASHNTVLVETPLENVVNVTPDYCEIECDRRLVPGETAHEVVAR